MVECAIWALSAGASAVSRQDLGLRATQLWAAACLAAFACHDPVRAAPAGGPEVWLGPVSDQVTPRGFQVDQDYPELFEPGTRWQHALSRITAFETVHRYVMTQPDQKLEKMFAFLREHHIALGVGFGVVPSRGGCGAEGTVYHADANLAAAQRLKKLGADLKYIVVDEAFTFGHSFTGRNACRYEINDLVSGFASEIRKIRSSFPGAQVIDVEAIGGMGTPSEFGHWLDALKREMGDRAPEAIRFDIQWDSMKKPWQEFAPPLVATVRQHGLRYGIIFNGTPNDPTDEAWIRRAKANIKAWEAAVRSPPDHVVIQSWDRHPERLLPETSPTTLTYLVNWYCENAAMARGCK